MSCTVTETLNGEWELTLVHDIDERGKWTRLSEGCILRAPVPAAMTPSVGLVTQQYQTSAYDVQIYKITTKSGPLHLRSGTGTNYKILGKYKKGREVIVLNKTTSSWYEVTAPDGKHGYMASQYLTFQRTETQAVQTNVGFRNQVIEARQLRDQPFRIYRVVPELDKVTVYARHIFYDLLDNMVKSLKPSPSAVGASVVQSLSGTCLSSHDFSFYSDLTSNAEDVEWENINPVEDMLGENGLVSKYGAELARDWYDVFLVKRVGNDTDVSIRERKNLTGISYDVDETDVVTRIMPTGEDADGNILYLPELYIDSPNLNAYTHPKWIHLPVSEAKEVTDGDEPKSKTQCYAEMRKAVQAEFDAGCDLPTITLKVDFISCSDAEEYKQYAALTDIFLGDSVRVVARCIGVEVSMRMTQYSYDCLTRKYTSVTLGTAADTLEGSMISSRQLPPGVISGSKLAINSVGAGQLQSGSVGSLQVKMAAIQTAHIQNAATSARPPFPRGRTAQATTAECWKCATRRIRRVWILPCCCVPARAVHGLPTACSMRAWLRPFRWPTAARALHPLRLRCPISVYSIPHRSPAAARTDRSVLCRSDEVKKLWAHFLRPPTAVRQSAMRSTALPHGAQAAAVVRVRVRIRVRLPLNPA